MKVTTNKSDKTFEPIELRITIESKEELDFWYAVFNAPNFAIKELIKNNGRNNTTPNAVDLHELFEIIRTI